MSVISYHEHNRFSRLPSLIERLQKGEHIALVSDAGMPGISDPGEELIKEAIHMEIPVIPVPGPNAALSAVVVSGFPVQPFLFLGFLPRNQKKRIKALKQWEKTPATLVCYEAPHRIRAMLKDVLHVMGDRRISIAREMTKKHEEWLRGTVSECIQQIEKDALKGELTVVVEGASLHEKEESESVESWWESLTLSEHVNWHINRGKTKKEAIRITAEERDLPKREVYNDYHRNEM